MTTKNHTPTPWVYAYGAVYRDAEDANRPDGVAIAMRGSQRDPCIEDQYTPTEKDANLRFIAHAVNCHYELLQALVTTTNELRATIRENGFDPSNSKEIKSAELIIARAEERTP